MLVVGHGGEDELSRAAGQPAGVPRNWTGGLAVNERRQTLRRRVGNYCVQLFQ